jgi:hypothetical protein
MFFTITVPTDEPSLFHSSMPLADVQALKYSVPLTFVRKLGSELAEPEGDVLHHHGAALGAVRLPQLVAGRCGVGREEQRAADRGEVAGLGAIGVRADVADHGRARGRPVRPPQFAAARVGRGREVQLAARRRELFEERVVEASVDVGQQVGAGSGPVADPQFRAGLRAERVEVEVVVPDDDVVRDQVIERAVLARPDLVDELGPFRRTVASPELAAQLGRVGNEVDLVAHRADVPDARAVRAGGDVLH